MDGMTRRMSGPARRADGLGPWAYGCRGRWSAAVCCVALWLAAIASAAQAAAAAGTQPAGPRPLFRGVIYEHHYTDSPRPLHVHVVRIDLREPGIDFLVTPSNGDAPKEASAMKTSSFLARYKCQVAINASPFRPYAPEEGWPQDVVGLAISRGQRYSTAHPKFGALLIGPDRRVWIAQPATDTAGAYNAVGGFGRLVAAGKSVATGTKRHPRTIVGIDRQGRYLWFVVMDGRQGGYSEGATLPEAAEWLLRLGAYEALNMDGGGSTTLVIEGVDGRPKVLNRPIAVPGMPGTERPVATHLGVFAERLGRPGAAATRPGRARAECTTSSAPKGR